MAVVRVSTPGADRREVEFQGGETLGALFSRTGIDLPQGSGIEVWVNGEMQTNWSGRMAQDQDAVVLVPQLKGATEFLFVLRAGRVS